MWAGFDRNWMGKYTEDPKVFKCGTKLVHMISKLSHSQFPRSLIGTPGTITPIWRLRRGHCLHFNPTENNTNNWYLNTFETTPDYVNKKMIVLVLHILHIYISFVNGYINWGRLFSFCFKHFNLRRGCHYNSIKFLRNISVKFWVLNNPLGIFSVFKSNFSEGVVRTGLSKRSIAMKDPPRNSIVRIDWCSHYSIQSRII